ncbi:MAG: hypothetical protein PUF16_05795 [Lachnospiraceae bacterium]|nr:hypothetical protein [Lachnospiraceae bacterium]
MEDIKVDENKDGSYTISGADASRLFNDISGIRSDMDTVSGTAIQIKEIYPEIKELSQDYLKSKQQIDGFIIFGIFVIVGLLAGRFLYGIFKH